MNAADLARLELAKRAYKAAQANDAEVQIGVRRARLALNPAKRRRNWFSKGLVFVVLAVGSLAYAKPNAIGEIVEKVLPRDGGASKHRTGVALASLPIEEAAKLGRATLSRNALRAGAAAGSDKAVAQNAVAQNAVAQNAVAQNAVAEDTATPSAAAPKKTASAAPTSGSADHADNSLAAAVGQGSSPAADAKPTAATSDWGRVGQALASGNNTEALAALGELSASSDERTRDKADMGRAQLLMSQGDTTQACSLARSLTHRRAGSRIERQAQLLLKSCTR